MIVSYSYFLMIRRACQEGPEGHVAIPMFAPKPLTSEGVRSAQRDSTQSPADPRHYSVTEIFPKRERQGTLRLKELWLPLPLGEGWGEGLVERVFQPKTRVLVLVSLRYRIL